MVGNDTRLTGYELSTFHSWKLCADSQYVHSVAKTRTVEENIVAADLTDELHSAGELQSADD